MSAFLYLVAERVGNFAWHDPSGAHNHMLPWCCEPLTFSKISSSHS